MLVEEAGLFDHRRRHVEPEDAVGVDGEGLGEAAEAAPEVEGPPPVSGQAQRLGLDHEASDLFGTGREELGRRPAVALARRVGQDRPHRVLTSEGVPVLLQILEVHVGRPRPRGSRSP